MASYKLTWLASQDLENLFEYGIDRFGPDQACQYFDGLKQRFADIASHPGHYPAVEHIRKHYRRSVYGIHSIYYTIEDSQITIVRILGKQDIITSLTPQ
ncbi:type II toxin-antitoxin system RelE/ParE family toxin [Endozoicomonas sp. Mp262]|uniref:type II toxin-antitoxin system RelE/ParE family toxin n=1 Tax=Endozoicomonas sp. Mp262 TaxID=2919499 RepID=UPI0021DAA129